MMDGETTKELAKLGTAALEFANRVFGGPLEQAGGLVSDQLGYWRAVRQLRLNQLFERARELYDAEGSGGLPQAVPMKLLEPIVRDATLEEDASLTEMWASLLASAADAEGAGRVQPSFPAILPRMSPAAARVMDLLYLRALRHGDRRPIRPQKIRGRCQLGVEEYERVVDLLLADGLVRVPSDTFVVARLGSGGPPGAAQDKTTRLALVLTATGFDFVAVCRRGRSDEPVEDDSDEDEPS